MKTMDFLEDYKDIRECDFKGEHYSVRDNGAVYRHARPGMRVRKNDNIWTFGKPNEKNGYMYLCSVRVHHIVAVAYYGDRDTKVYVVDHKDSNRRNNRVENLHWLTKLENVLSNPATRKKIIICCGSLETFLSNPSIIRRFANQNPEYSWMRTVSKEEAKQTLDNMNDWAQRPIEEFKGGKMGEWIYKSLGFNPQMEIMNELTKNSQKKRRVSQITPITDCSLNVMDSGITEAKSPSSAVQKDWTTPTDFPLCPTVISKEPLKDYYNCLSKGAVMTQNVYGGTTIVDFAFKEDESYIWVLGKRTEKNPVKAWTLAGISFENGKFVHENLHSFFEEIGGLKYFTLAQGKEWTGGDCFDDFC